MRLHRLTAPGRHVAILPRWLQRRQILPPRVLRQTALVETLGLSARPASSSGSFAPFAPGATLIPRATSVAVPPVRRFLPAIRLPDQHSQADGAPLAFAPRPPTTPTVPREADRLPRQELPERDATDLEGEAEEDDDSTLGLSTSVVDDDVEPDAPTETAWSATQSGEPATDRPPPTSLVAPAAPPAPPAPPAPLVAPLTPAPTAAAGLHSGQPTPLPEVPPTGADAAISESLAPLP